MRALLVVTFVPALALAYVQLDAARSSAIARHRSEAMITTLAAERAPLALIDVGLIGYRLPERELVDLGGLTDARIARMAGNHVDRRIDVAYLEERQPSQFLLHSARAPELVDGRLLAFQGYGTEMRLVRDPWFRRHYTPTRVFEYNDGYWYVLFERR